MPRADDYSVHISLGIKVKTFADILRSMLDSQIEGDESFRKALPIDFVNRSFDMARIKAFIPLLIDSLSGGDCTESLRGVERDFLANRKSNMNGVLSSIAASEELNLDTVIEMPSGAVIAIDDHSRCVTLNGVSLQFEAHLLELVRFICDKKNVPCSRHPCS